MLLAGSALASSISGQNNYKLHPFTINLSSGVPRMIQLAKDTRLYNVIESPGDSAGITSGTLQSLQKEWVQNFNWEKEQKAMNKYDHFTAQIEGLTIHFIHQKSKVPGAIPLILNHGWPGSFLEFLPVIDSLVQKSTTSSGKSVAFDVVVPSLPGYAFSSQQPANWTVADTARVFNTLMTDILGYKKYATHGTDWGCAVAYSLYESYTKAVRAGHFTFIPFFPKTSEELADLNITLSPLEEFEEGRFESWSTVGNAYFSEQSTKPNTIGLALYDNPVGQLAWIGEKFIDWSDPRAGHAPSIINHNEILKSVSLYYLTKSIVSSMYVYFQNPGRFRTTYAKAPTDAPMLFSAFKYNIAFWPQELVAQVGNLVSYRNHEFGGHFAGLDNPPALVGDLREIGEYWA
ncbi:Alpha/Beta hydrolase protein [Xylogone sp. PMI_703]|nr:Alpha/Beta hydrolase protein [Xylogone sp. PMI_703]